MPIISSFTGVAARGFGFTNGLPPLPPTDISFVTSEINAVVTFSTSPTSYPVDIVQAKIMQGVTLISDWATVTSGGNISASNLTPALVYTAYFRTRDTGGQISQEVSQTFTTSVETPPGAPTFSLAVASGDAGTFKFNITWTAGTAGTYSRTTQYRVETSAGAQLLDWTTVSSSPIAYGADTYNGAGALTPSTTYSVRLRSVAATSGTITNAAYQTVTTNAIVAPNAPTSLSAAPVAGTPGEFSFAFSHTPGTARSYPVYGSQYRIRTNNSGTITYLSGYSSYQEFSGTITIGTSSYVSANLTPGSTYYIDTRTYDTLGTFSTVTSTSVTLTAQRVPGAPTFSLAVASGDAGSFKFNITSTGGTIGSYPRITQYRIETSAGAQLLDWTTISSNSSTVTAYGADTYNGAGALTPGTTYRVRLKSVADTSGTITYSSPAYQDVTTDAIVAPNAPTSLSATPVATGYQGEFSFTFSHTPGTARSYPVSGSEYRIRTNNSGTITYLSGYSTYQNFAGTIAIGTSTYLNAILTPGSTYYIDTRTYDTLGTRSGVTSTSVTLAAKRNPGTPTGLAAVKVATGNQGEFSFTFSHTTVAGSYPVSASQYRIRTGASTYLSGYSSYQDFSGTVTIGTSTYLNAILTPGSTYYVDTRTYDTEGDYSTVASDDVILTAKRDPTVSSLTVAAPSYNGTNTTTLDVAFDGGTGSWPINSCQYSTNAGTNWKTFSGSAPYSFGVLSSSTAALVADTAYTVYVRAVDTQGNVSGSVSGTATTNAPVPATPAFTSNGMSGSSAGTVNIFVSQPSYATRAFVEVSTSSTFAAGVTTFDSDTNTGNFTYSSANSRWAFSASGQAYGTTIYYRAYVRNRHGSTGESGYSTTRTWVTPTKNVYYSSTIHTTEIQFAATNSSLDGCAQSDASITFGSIPATNNSVGYINITAVGVKIRGGGFYNTNTDYLYFSYPGGTASSGLDANVDNNLSSRFNTISVGGSTLSGGTIALNFLWAEVNPSNYVHGNSYSAGNKVRHNSQNWLALLGSTNIYPGTNGAVWQSGANMVNPTGSAARNYYSGGTYGCIANGSNYFIIKDFYVEGVYTSAGSFT